jgi:ribosome biogenesis GTPase / thiamine phosphate phosphatase
VQAALADGRLDGGRWRSYAKLRREAARAARKDDPADRARARKVWVQRTRRRRAHERQRPEDD